LNVARALPLLASFALIALGVVYLRAEQTRSAAETLKLEAQWTELRRERWLLQTRAARLRSPTQIHERVARFDVDLAPPGADGAWMDGLDRPLDSRLAYSP
jgi:hypothetical protein